MSQWAAPALAAGEPYSLEHGSVEQELVARASHMHALFREEQLGCLLQTGRGKQEEHHMRPLSSHSRWQNKAGRHGWQSLGSMQGRTSGRRKSSDRSNSSTHVCGRDRAIFPWRSSSPTTAMPLSSMQACAEQHPVPAAKWAQPSWISAGRNSNQWTPVLQAAMASIRTDDGPDGKRNDFEQSAAHLLPYDPVAKKHAAGSSKKRQRRSVGCVV